MVAGRGGPSHHFALADQPALYLSRIFANSSRNPHIR